MNGYIGTGEPVARVLEPKLAKGVLCSLYVEPSIVFLNVPCPTLNSPIFLSLYEAVSLGRPTLFRLTCYSIKTPNKHASHRLRHVQKNNQASSDKQSKQLVISDQLYYVREQLQRY